MKKYLFTLTIVFFWILSGYSQYCASSVITYDEYVSYTGGWGSGSNTSPTFAECNGKRVAFDPVLGVNCNVFSLNPGANTLTITLEIDNFVWDPQTNEDTHWFTEEKVTKTIQFQSPSISGLSESYTTLNNPVALTGAPAGGSFSGIGVNWTTFDPKLSGVGNFTVYYSVTSGGCTYTTSKEVKVIQGTVISNFANITACTNGAAVQLSAYPTGGIYSGPGVSGSSFDPKAAGAGTHTITYKVNEATASVTATVNVPPVVTLSLPVKEMVKGTSAITLSGGNPSSGSYAGSGVSENLGIYTFTPSQFATNVISYTYQDQATGCSSTATDYIVVIQPSANFGSQNFCDGDTRYVDPQGGSFYFNGSVISNTFSSGIFGGPGAYSVTWKKSGFADGTVPVVIYARPTASFSGAVLCQGAGAINLDNYVTPTGGTFSGTGVSGNTFDANLSPASYSISYKLSNTNCSTTKYATFTIAAQPSVSLSIPAEQTNLYPDDASFTLTGGSPAGGTYYVDGVVRTSFNPASYSPGDHTVRYFYTNGTCSGEGVKTIRMNPLGSVSFSNMDFCINQAPVTLNAQGGTFFINSTPLSGGQFNPASFGVGSYTVTWKRVHYADATFKINVHALPTISVTTVPNLCTNSLSIDLKNYVNPSHGTFSGTGIENGTFFNPVATGAGSFSITYTLSDSYCSESKTLVLKVYDLPVISLTPPNVTYTDDPAVSLITHASPAGGSFLINNAPGTTFNPGNLGAGTHTISYSYTNAGGCKSTKSITVNLVQRETFVFNDLTVCSAQGNVQLPQNSGVYTIDGTTLTGGVFETAKYTPGVYIVSWKKSGYYDQNFKITLVQTPAISLSTVANQCIYGAAFDLKNYVTPKTGTFSGNGVNGSILTPAVAKAGTHEILYTVSNNSCYTEVKIPVKVIGVEALNFEGINGFCSTAAPVDLTRFVDHQGGVFSSADGGIVGNMLYPEQLTEGNHNLVYTINTGSGCEQSDQATIYIMNPPSVSLPSFSPIYVDAPAFALYGGSPSGGQYYVNGVLTNNVNPGNLGIGTHTIRYVYSNSACENYAEASIQIQALQSNSFQDKDVCLADAAIKLTENGGIYSVDGTNLSGGIFNPAAFGKGSWEVTWKKPSFADAKFKITVHENPQILVTDQTLCLNQAKVDMTTNSLNADVITVTGKGVEQNKYFNPVAAGPGVHSITITASNNYCYTEKVIRLTVQGVENLSFSNLNSFCSASAPVDLTTFVNQQGGTFSSTDGGIVGNMLYPETLSEGNHNLVYTLQFSQNCSQSISTQFFIMNPPKVTLPALTDVYVDAPAFALYGGSPSGGQYYVNGVLNNVADPGKLGVGTHTIKYVFANSACENYAETTLTVMPLTANFSDRVICYYSEPLNFLEDGGIYYVNGVNIRNSFDPKKYGPGIYNVTWKKESYADAAFKITVNKNPEISFSSPGQICANTDKIDLNNYVYPTGGNFIGKGIEQNRYFNPKTTGGGSFEVIYSLSENGCVTQVKQGITVDKDVKLNFTSPSIICKGAQAIDLNTFVNVQGCSFESASGGLINNMLYPSLMDFGQHKITATYTSGGCNYSASRSIYVLEPVQAYLTGLDGPFYLNDEPTFLTGGIPEGGTYYVDGIARSIIDPANLGVGLHTVTYSFTSTSGCSASAQKTITISKPRVDYFNNKSICHGTVLYLPEFDGRFYINGNLLNNGIFNSSQFGPGTYTVTWKKEGYADATFSITVNAVPDVISVKVPDLCVDSEAIDLTNFVEPKVGSFSGPGLENNKIFNPAKLGEGEFTVLYTLKNEHCYREVKIPIKVNSLKNITFSGLDVICKNSAAVDLSGFVSPSGGKFSSPDGGVIDNKLFPKMLSAGQHKILYTVENSGCSKSEEQLIYIVEPEAVTLDATAFNNVYSNSQPIYLNIANTTGGVYTINGQQSNVFDPAVLGSGLHTVNYTYTDNITGCVATGEIRATVKGKKLSNFGDRKICQNDAQLEFDPDGGIIYCNSVALPSGIFNPSNYAPGAYSCTWQKEGFADTDFVITVLESTNITVFEIPTLCPKDGKINLLNYVEPKTGSFSGGAIQDGKYFDPALTGGGEFKVVYTVKNGLCYDEKELIIKVNATEEIVFSGLAYSVCNASSPIDLMKYVYPQTGTFSCDEGAVVNNILYPSLLSKGEHIITYTINDPTGCKQVAEKKIYILQEPATTFNLAPDVCNNAAPFRLSGGQPLGGKYFIDNKEVVIFNPSEYTPGLHVIEYRFTNSMGCTSSASAHLNVKQVTAATLQAPEKLCDNAGPVTLKGGYPAGGQYFVDGAAVTSFDPATFRAGQFVVQYQFSKDGCTSIAQQEINVVQTTPVTIFDQKPICKNALPIEPVGGSPAGGFYAIDGKMIQKIDPSILSGGNHTLSYSMSGNGCTSMASTTLTIIDTEEFTLNIPSNLCENGSVVALNVVSPSGGTYSGSGVTAGQLDLAAIGAGTFYYEYDYKSKNGCRSVIPFTITVNPAPVIEMPAISQVCNNADPIALSVLPEGGTWSGNGIVNSVLYPNLAGKGIQQMTYTVKNKYGCSSTKALSFVVNTPEALTVEDLGVICQNGEPVALDFVSPSGGIYSGPGIVENVLYPQKITPGTKTIKYSYFDAKGCNSVAESKVVVNKIPEIQDFYLDKVCSNDNPIALETESIYAKSVYTGKGVVKNTFDPEIAGVGESKIRYLIMDKNGCTNYSEKDVSVMEAPYVFMQKKLLCAEQQQEVALNTGFPSGGTYQGDFVVGGKFMPFTPGIYSVKYSYTATNGCSQEASNYVTVNEIPVATIQQYPNICVNSEKFDLYGGNPSGGQYFVNGTKTTNFDPAKMGVGTYVIKYSVANATGCMSTVETSFKVMATEDVSITDLKAAYCKNSAPVDLAGWPVGGKFFVNNKLASQLDPKLLETGTSKVTYAFDSKSGCTVYTSREVEINPVPEVPQLDLKSIYCPGDEIMIKPTNFKAEYQILVKTALNSPAQKADYGKTVYKADVVSALNVYYCNEYGCNSEQNTYNIQIENRNPEIVTSSKNIKKGDLLQFTFLDKYDYIKTFDWQFSDGGISYDPEPYHYFNIPGYNSVELKYCTYNGCNFSKKLNNYIYVINSDELVTDVISPETGNTEIKVYPNPATEIVNIDFPSDEKYDVQIFNNFGSLCKEVKGLQSLGTVQLNGLVSGSYVLKISVQQKPLKSISLIIK